MIRIFQKATVFVALSIVPNSGLAAVNLTCTGSGFMYGFPEDKKPYKIALQVDDNKLTESLFDNILVISDFGEQWITAELHKPPLLYRIKLNRYTGEAIYNVFSSAKQYVNNVGSIIRYLGVDYAFAFLYKFECKSQPPLF